MTPRTPAETGAMLLDRADPGWWRADRQPAIDPGTINVNDEDLCPVGQLYGGARYHEALTRLGLNEDWAAWDDEVAHGFYACTGAGRDQVSGDWARIIRQRRHLPLVCMYADHLNARHGDLCSCPEPVRSLPPAVLVCSR